MAAAIVTGASRGIGRAIALELASLGYDVGCAARTEADLRATVREIESASGDVRALALPCDVTDALGCVRAAALAAKALGGIEILVNNAGLGVFGEISTLSPAEWDRMIATNLSGAFYMTRAVLPAMLAARRGHIVNIASVAGHRGFAGGAAYAASKFGLVGFTESLMLELRRHDVRVTLVSPGSVDTDFLPPNEDRSWMLRPQDVAAAVRYAVAAREGMLVDHVLIRPTRPPSTR